MCNCGNKRESFSAQSSGAAKNESIKKQEEKMWPDINFIYTGQSALSATGNITGKVYRFNRPGDKQPVDYRDAPSMIKVPVLKRI
jgi:hypothetical protein